MLNLQIWQVHKFLGEYVGMKVNMARYLNRNSGNKVSSIQSIWSLNTDASSRIDFKLSRGLIISFSFENISL